MTNPEFFLTDPSSRLGQRWPRLGEAHTGAGNRKVKLNNEWGWGWRQKEFFLKIPRRGRRCLGQHPWEPGPCPEGKLSCYSGRVHTYTPASGFRGFPYLWQTTFSPSNKDHLSCLSQTSEPTRKQKGVGSTLEVGACQWLGPGGGRKPGPGPEKELQGEEAKPAGHHQRSLAGSSSHTGFGSGKLA